jgi:choline dehydrogenase
MQYEFLPITRQLKNGKLRPVPGFQFWLTCHARRAAAP